MFSKTFENRPKFAGSSYWVWDIYILETGSGELNQDFISISCHQGILCLGLPNTGAAGTMQVWMVGVPGLFSKCFYGVGH